MVWNAPKTYTGGQALTAAELNSYLRDNLLECAPAKATTPGGYFVSVSPNKIAQRITEKSTVLDSESTTSLSYVGMTNTPGPAVTLNTGTEALAIWGGQMSNSTSGFSCFMSIAVSGATTVVADSDEALRFMQLANDQMQSSQFKFFTDLEPGLNTFTCQYAVGGGTGTFLRRRLIVIPY